MTEAEIIADAKKAHDDLSAGYYAGTSGLTKEQFDALHGSVWQRLASDLIAAGHRATAVEPRDLAREIDSLKERVAILEPRLP